MLTPTSNPELSTCDGQPPLWRRSCTHVLEAPDDALAAGVERLAERRGIAGQGVRRRERVDQKLGGEARLCFPRSTHSGGVEEFVDKSAEQQILLSQQEVRRILLIGRIGESFVATGDRDGTGIVTADRAFAGSPKRPGITPEQTGVGSEDPGRISQRHPRGGQQLTNSAAGSAEKMTFSATPIRS